MLIENDANAETSSEQNEFLDDITRNEIQLIKFLDFHDILEYFKLMVSCNFCKRKDMENLQRELYQSVESDFNETLNNLFYIR